MPSYDYICEINGKVLEVKHRISEVVNNWGELCTLAEIDTGDTPTDSPVRKLATGGQVLSSGSRNDNIPPCASGGCCGGGVCGH